MPAPSVADVGWKAGATRLFCVRLGLAKLQAAVFVSHSSGGFVGSFRLYPNFGDKKHSKNTVDWRLKKQNGFNTQALLRSDVVGTMFIYVVKYTYEIIYIYTYIYVYIIYVYVHIHITYLWNILNHIAYVVYVDLFFLGVVWNLKQQQKRWKLQALQPGCTVASCGLDQWVFSWFVGWCWG